MKKEVQYGTAGRNEPSGNYQLRKRPKNTVVGTHNEKKWKRKAVMKWKPEEKRWLDMVEEDLKAIVIILFNISISA